MLGGAAVAENSVALDEDLIDVDDQASSVPQSEAPLDPFDHCVSVLLVIAGSAQVARAEDVGLLLDDKVVVRDDPRVIDGSEFLHLVGFRVVVDAGGPGSEDGDHCIDLVSELVADEPIGAGLPDGEDASDGEVGVDDGAAVEGIVSDHIAFALSEHLIFRLFLAGESLDQRVLGEMLLNDGVALHILMQLLISERIGGIKLNNGRVSEEGRDLNSGVEDALDDRGFFSFDDGSQVLSWV